LVQILSSSLNDHLVEIVEEESDMEARDTSLKADLCSSIFNHDFLVLVLGISVVKLWNLLQDPIDLSVSLLLQIAR
jgi:hypothetical protein